MRQGGKILVSTAVLALAACGGSQGKFEVRSLPTPLGPGNKPMSVRVAEGHSKLKLGNVALALESFRKANREDPSNIEALAGMAVCYDQMGRFDVSRQYYEAALAIAPANAELLSLFAASLQGQGLASEAASVRQEVAARTAVPAATPKLVARSFEAAPAPQVAEMSAPVARAQASLPDALLATSTVHVEPVPTPVAHSAALLRPSFAAQPVQVAEAADTPSTIPVSVPIAEAGRIEIDDEAPAVAAAPAIEPAAEVHAAALGPSVTIKLPPARPVATAMAAKPVAPSTPAPSPGPAAPAPQQAPADQLAALPEQVKRYARPIPKPTVAEQNGPRLERLSMGEIALITASQPIWRTTTAVMRSAQATRVRYVPLREANALPARVRILNAARVDRLAARTRSWLAARGWRSMGIGNADSTRVASVILYPADQRWLAQRLSAQFGFAMAQRASATQVTVLLGSDAARHPALRRTRG